MKKITIITVMTIIAAGFVFADSAVLDTDKTEMELLWENYDEADEVFNEAEAEVTKAEADVETAEASKERRLNNIRQYTGELEARVAELERLLDEANRNYYNEGTRRRDLEQRIENEERAHAEEISEKDSENEKLRTELYAEREARMEVEEKNAEYEAVINDLYQVTFPELNHRTEKAEDAVKVLEAYIPELLTTLGYYATSINQYAAGYVHVDSMLKEAKKYFGDSMFMDGFASSVNMLMQDNYMIEGDE